MHLPRPLSLGEASLLLRRHPKNQHGASSTSRSPRAEGPGGRSQMLAHGDTMTETRACALALGRRSSAGGLSAFA